MELVPEFDPTLEESVIRFNYASPSIADVPDETVFTLSLNVIFTSTAKVETITFEVSLEHCESIWPAEQTEVLWLEQSTQNPLIMFDTYKKVNQAISCSKTRLQLV